MTIKTRGKKYLSRSNLIRRASIFYISKNRPGRKTLARDGKGKREGEEGEYLDSRSRPDISILRAHKAPLEGDAQMTNRSANNKSGATLGALGIRRVENGEARSRVTFTRNADRRGIEYSSRSSSLSPAYAKPARSGKFSMQSEI